MRQQCSCLEKENREQWQVHAGEDGQHQDLDRILRGRVNQNGRESTSVVWSTLELTTARLGAVQAAKLVAGLAESNGSRVYDSRHLQADCQEPGSYTWVYK